MLCCLTWTAKGFPTASSGVWLSLPGALPAIQLGLILLKLEAGSPQDAADILALLGNAKALGRLTMRMEVEAQTPSLTSDARAFWQRITGLWLSPGVAPS